jgi:hypothetical protein
VHGLGIGAVWRKFKNSFSLFDYIRIHSSFYLSMYMIVSQDISEYSSRNNGADLQRTHKHSKRIG